MFIIRTYKKVGFGCLILTIALIVTLKGPFQGTIGKYEGP